MRCGAGSSRTVLALGALARLATWHVPARALPAFLFLDLLDAFPGVVSRRWLAACLEHVVAPVGFRNNISAWLSESEALVHTQKGLVQPPRMGVASRRDAPFPACCSEWRMTLSCGPTPARYTLDPPFAPVLMAWVPFCSILPQWRRVPIMRDAKDFADLSLRPDKSFVVPMSQALDDAIQRRVRERIRRVAPEWCAFRVVPWATHLGYAMRPKAVVSFSPNRQNPRKGHCHRPRHPASRSRFGSVKVSRHGRPRVCRTEVTSPATVG